MEIQQLSVADARGLAFDAGAFRTSDKNKVRENAIQFEALLIGQLLDKLQHTFAPEEDQHGDPARDTVSSLGTHAVAEVLASRHTFGFAEMLERAVSQSAEVSRK
ncbi:MAG TPA: hypothetical protein VF786_08040 [Terriglobales bacterium]